MSARFVEADWQLISERFEQLEGEPEDEDHRLQIFLTSYEDGREIWATRREVVELQPGSNKVVRRFSLAPTPLESVSLNGLQVSIPAPLCDETGSYLVLHGTSENGTCLWRLDLRPKLELRTLGSIWRAYQCAVSVDGNWIAGIRDQLGLPSEEYWRCRLDCRRRNDAIRFGTGESCPLMHLGTFAVRIFGIDESGCVWFRQKFFAGRTCYGRWPYGSSPVEFVPSFADPLFDVHSNSAFKVRFGRFDQAEIQPLIAQPSGSKAGFSLDWPVDFSNERPFSNVTSLLKMSTTSHRDAFKSFLRPHTLYRRCALLWNDNQSRIGISWLEDVNEWANHALKKGLFRRVELRVVKESDSLLNTCAARIARDPKSKNEIGLLPTELRTLVENFRTAGSIFKSNELGFFETKQDVCSPGKNKKCTR